MLGAATADSPAAAVWPRWQTGPQVQADSAGNPPRRSNTKCSGYVSQLHTSMIVSRLAGVKTQIRSRAGSGWTLQNSRGGHALDRTTGRWQRSTVTKVPALSVGGKRVEARRPTSQSTVPLKHYLIEPDTASSPATQCRRMSRHDLELATLGREAVSLTTAGGCTMWDHESAAWRAP